MSAAGLNYGARSAIISAHADHNRSDFVFLRCQSQMLRDTPWERRLKPLKPWSEIGAYAAAGMAGVAVLTAAMTALL